MSAQPLIDLLGKLLKLHTSLNQLAIEKTKAIKLGNFETLNFLIKKEQTHISAIEIIEKERVKILGKLFPDKVNPSLTECVNSLEESDRKEIQSIQQKLMAELDQLKEANSLNQELLEQSLQYITLSLDLLLPNELPNYTKGNEEESSLPQHSLFDSKA